MRECCSFWVDGIPQTAGSKVALRNHKTGRTHIIESGGNEIREEKRCWRAMIQSAFMQTGMEMLWGPLQVRYVFHFPRPKTHYRNVKKVPTLRDDAPHWAETRADIDKLQRAANDALTHFAWDNDRQICVTSAEKIYNSDGPGMRVEIAELEDV
jgi:Holliday junction resolvase RusA-like endonuclease